MTTTDLTRARREVARKTPANAVTSRNAKVIDGTARPTRSVARQASKSLILLVMALLLLGFLLSSLGYYG